MRAFNAHRNVFIYMNLQKERFLSLYSVYKRIWKRKKTHHFVGSQFFFPSCWRLSAKLCNRHFVGYWKIVQTICCEFNTIKWAYIWFKNVEKKKHALWEKEKKKKKKKKSCLCKKIFIMECLLSKRTVPLHWQTSKNPTFFVS